MKDMIHSLRIILVVTLLWLTTVTLQASPLGEVSTFASKGGTVTINAARGKILITPISDDIVKVAVIAEGEKLAEKPSKSVVMKANAKFAIEADAQSIIVNIGDRTTVTVNRATALLSFAVNGATVLNEDGGITSSNGQRKVTFGSSRDEAFYGTGERGLGYNLSGDTLVMFNKQNYGYERGNRTAQMNITVPFYISSRGYGVYFDDYTASRLILKCPVQYETNSRTPVPYYFIGSPDRSIAGVVKGFTALTGRQELPPFWSMGYITSKYGYKTQSETMGVIDTLQREGYPVDGIVLDLYWYGKETDMGRLEWNHTQWPDHVKMLADLKAKGVKTIIISQPYLNKIGAIGNYNMAAARGMLTRDSLGRVHDVHTWVGDAGMLDVSNPTTRQWLWSRYKALTLEGVSGWWGDLGEPEVHPLTIRHYNGETASEYHNIYGNEWSRIIYEGFKKDFSTVRLMTLMRGGTAGLQRYSVFPWSTDVSRSWGGLQAQMPIMLNTALSGLGYMSHDVGGFAVDKAHPVNAELYVRWLEMGLFTPILRTHSTVDAEPYHYTQPGYQALLKKLIKARYEWLPYNYTLAYENATTGAPLVRPLNFYSAADTTLRNIDDEYLWGRDVLVAPVTEPATLARSVYFPEGKWYSLDDSRQSFTGPQRLDIDAPLGKIPVFVRSGAIIPQARYTMRNTGDYDPSRYTVTYYPGTGATSRYTLYDDDRTDTRSISANRYLLMNFTAREDSAYIAISVAPEGMGYKGMPEQRHFTIECKEIARAPHGVMIGTRPLSPDTKGGDTGDRGDNCYHYDPATRTLTVNFSWDYHPATLTIEK